MFLIVNSQIEKCISNVFLELTWAFLGNLKCVLPSDSGCVGSCAVQGVAHRGTGLLCWTGVIAVKFQTVVLWALYQAASRFF